MEDIFYSTRFYDAIPEKFLGETILEVGASTGLAQTQSKHAEKFSSNYLGIDLFFADNSRLNIIKVDAIDFDYQENKYDTILSVATLEHIDFSNWENLLQKWKSALKKNGYIVIIVPDRELPIDHLKTDYYTAKNQTENGYAGHRVFSIDERVFKHFLGDLCYIKRIRQPLRFRGESESLVWALLRFCKRVVFFHYYVWDAILRKKQCLLVVYQKRGEDINRKL